MRCIWEPYHEAAAMEKVAENARYDRQQLFKASQLAKEAAAKVKSRASQPPFGRRKHATTPVCTTQQVPDSLKVLV